MNVVTKSGTNTIHGTAYEFFSNTALNSIESFPNRAGGSKQVLVEKHVFGEKGSGL